MKSGSTSGTDRPRETGVPVVFIYGDKDWMDKQGGWDSEDKMKAERKKALSNASEEEKRMENGSARTLIVKNAGHHVYLDGWDEFNRLMEEEMKDVERRQAKLAKAREG
jgi:cardiolipin-specific phospholipase